MIRTWTATDCTGNESVATQEIVVSDSGAPEWSMEIPADVTVECSAVPEPPIWTAVDNCDDNVEVVLTEEIVEGPCPSRYTLIRTWTATDDCGNFIEGSQTSDCRGYNGAHLDWLFAGGRSDRDMSKHS